MEYNQRKRILDNIDLLIDFTDFGKLCDACYDCRLLSSTMIENIHRIEPRDYSSKDYNDDNIIEREQHRNLFIKITKRGPKAFEKLRQILVALKYKNALNILFDANEDISIKSSKKLGTPTQGNIGTDQESSDSDSSDDDVELKSKLSNNNNETLHEYEGLVQPKKNVFVRKANNITIDPKIGTYHMESKDKRGIFFMVKSDERQQKLDEDDHLLLSLFQQLGFKIYAYSNITVKTFLNLLNELLNSDKIKDIECFVLAIRTGGQIISGVQRMTFNDGSVVKVEQIQEYFYHRKCPQLVGKPKIFIFPYCELQRRTQIDSIGQGGNFLRVSQLSDVINCYVTTSGYMDHRDNDNFSCYIKNFVDIIAERACDTHFENMLKKIQKNVAELSKTRGNLQVASYDNVSFNKMLYFNPGISI